MQEVKRFDMAIPPKRMSIYLRILTWVLSFPAVWLRRLKITKTAMEGLKPPYLLLCTHKSFMDFKVATACTFPHRSNNVVAIDGFIGREKLLRNVGCICKRKFTNDIQLIRHIKQVIDNKDILILYPEARYSLIGTNACLPESLGKLAKMLKVPVVMLHMHGNYIHSPFWNLEKRKVRLEAEMTQIITQAQIDTWTPGQVNDAINTVFVYDEYRWQKDNDVRVDFKDRAKGLHKVLYMCKHCGTEYKTASDKDRLWCNHCGSAWKMNELGQLVTEDGSETMHIPDWYEMEREHVRKQIKDGSYCFEEDVIVDSLPSADGYVRLGEAKLRHDISGFVLEGCFDGQRLELKKDPLSMYSCHIEYEYYGKGDCIDLSTLEDTYYIYPQSESFSVTKIALATEELYRYTSRQKKVKF